MSPSILTIPWQTPAPLLRRARHTAAVLAVGSAAGVFAADPSGRNFLELDLRPDDALRITAEPSPLDALGQTDCYQAMWPTDATMPGADQKEFPQFRVEPVDGRKPGVALGKRLPMTPALEGLLPEFRFFLRTAGQIVPLYSGGARAQIAHRVGNLLRLVDLAPPMARQTEMIFVSHRRVLLRFRLAQGAASTLCAEAVLKSPDGGAFSAGPRAVWTIENERGSHGLALQRSASAGEGLAVAVYDAPTPAALQVELDAGRAEAARFDSLWQQLARPHSLEPFLAGRETALERNLIAACVNRVLRNARGGGDIRTPSLLEFFGREWHTANAVWICFQPACRYALWIEPSLWANSMRTLFERQAPDGRVPQAVYANRAMGNSQIPNISPCLRDYYMFTRDRQFLADLYPRLKRWYEWWLAERNPTGDGIIAVGAGKQDLWTAICEYKDNHTDPAAPTFWDTCNPLTRTAEIAGRPDRVYLPDIVACQARMAEDLAFLAGELGRGDEATSFAAEYRRVRDWANRHLWDEKTRFYYPVVRATGQKLMKRSNVAFWLLWAGIPDERQKQALVAAMFDPQQFFTPIPLPMIALDDPSFNPKCGHWGDGYVWPIDVFHAFDGLLRYGEWDAAARLAEQFNRGVFKAIERTYQPKEYYHHSGRAAGNPIMGTAGCLPLTFQRYLRDHRQGKAQEEWVKFAPPAAR